MSAIVLGENMTSVSEVQRNISGVIARSIHTPQLIVRHNKPTAVILGVDRFNEMQNRILTLEDMMDHVMLYVELKARGEHSDEEVTLEELAKEYNL